jgi:hypothetical protein
MKDRLDYLMADLARLEREKAHAEASAEHYRLRLEYLSHMAEPLMDELDNIYSRLVYLTMAGKIKLGYDPDAIRRANVVLRKVLEGACNGEERPESD